MITRVNDCFAGTKTSTGASTSIAAAGANIASMIAIVSVGSSCTIQFQGSSDNSTWITIGTITNATGIVSKPVIDCYAWYRCNISAISSTTVRVYILCNGEGNQTGY